MTKITKFMSTVAIASLVASAAHAGGLGVAVEEPLVAPPKQVQKLMRGSGGISNGTLIAAAVIGTVLVLTFLNSDGTTSTTTTEISGS